MEEEKENHNSYRKIVELVGANTQDIRSALFPSSDDGDGDETPPEPSVEMQTKIILQHLRSCYAFNSEGQISKANNVLDITFDNAFEWINSDSPRKNLHEDALSNLVLVDFFTHCCINCIHSIEDLRFIHSKLSPKICDEQENQPESELLGFKVISIHSPKFPAEKQSASIKASVHRMKMDYTEVINDPNNTLWYKLGICCWPTIMIFGPNLDTTNPGPNLLFVLYGEGHRKILELFSTVALQFFKKNISREQVASAKSKLPGIPLPTERDSTAPGIQNLSLNSTNLSAKKSILNFPGKVTSYKGIICISDSGNNRIIITNLAGNIKHIIGGEDSGFENGDFTRAKFCNPQGTAFKNKEILYVADTGNYAVRMVDLKNAQVTTLVDPNTGIVVPGTEAVTMLKSPWDLCFYGDGDSSTVLLVASAGNHQIFGYFFEACKLFKVEHSKNSFNIIAGSGKEENRNNAYILKSGFAQPSGICSHTLPNSKTGTDETTIFIADSESSSIRCITEDGKVAAVVGGERDPNNLFAFGDQDGLSYDVKLQHPISVTPLIIKGQDSPSAGQIFIADTYNHKIKIVDAKTKNCSTLIGSVAGNCVGKNGAALLNEPAGLSWSRDFGFLFIADTNNHCIKVAQPNLEKLLNSEIQIDVVSTFNLELEDPSKEPAMNNSKVYFIFELPMYCAKLDLSIVVHNIPDKIDGGKWRIFDPSSPSPSLAYPFDTNISTGSIPETLNEEYLTIAARNLPFVPWLKELCFEFTLFICHQNVCSMKTTQLFARLNSKFISAKLEDGPKLVASCNPTVTPKLIIDFAPIDSYFLH